MTTAVNWLDLDTDLDCLSKLSVRCQCDLSTSKSVSNDCGITIIEIPPNKPGAGSILLQVQWVTVAGLPVFIHHLDTSCQLFVLWYLHVVLQGLHNVSWSNANIWTFFFKYQYSIQSHVENSRAINSDIDNYFVYFINGWNSVHIQRKSQSKYFVLSHSLCKDIHCAEAEWLSMNCRGHSLLAVSEYLTQHLLFAFLDGALITVLSM